MQSPQLSRKNAGNMRHRSLSPMGWTGAYRVALIFLAATVVGCAKPIHKPTTRPAPATAAPVPPLVARPAGRPTVGVAFGGGSARGIAHVGVIRWFEEHRIPIDLAAGTSMGGLVGGAFATGITPAELDDLLRHRLGRAVRRVELRVQEHQAQGRRARLPVAPRVRPEGAASCPAALNNGRQVDLMSPASPRRITGIETFDELPTPFRAVAVDLSRRHADRDRSRAAGLGAARHDVAAVDLSAGGVRRPRARGRRRHEQRPGRRRPRHGCGRVVAVNVGDLVGSRLGLNSSRCSRRPAPARSTR